MLNSYFKIYSNPRYQRILQNQVEEIIKRYGILMYYIPKNISTLDTLFGEDPSATLDYAKQFEFLPKTTDSFAGEGFLASKFGLEIRENMSFFASKTRWDQIKDDNYTTENGFSYLLESANTVAPTTSGQSFCYDLEEGANPFAITFADPRVGDLLLFPFANKVFQIDFVNPYELFYPMGVAPVYTIDCSLFEYSDEQANTGISTIDDLLNSLDTNMLDYGFELENGTGVYLCESESADEFDPSGEYIQEEYAVDSIDKLANNSIFTTLSTDVVDFSEQSPLVE